MNLAPVHGALTVAVIVFVAVPTERVEEAVDG
jgi:hypothetical protein